MTDEELLVAVVSLIAREMGEDPGALPSRERLIRYVEISMCLLDHVCHGDPASIRLLVDEILKSPSRKIVIDSV